MTSAPSPSGLRLILDDQPDISVVAEASDGVDAIEMARRLRPDVCLVDIRMPRLDGIEVTRALAGPDVRQPMRVIVVTTFDLDEYVYGALRRHRGFQAVQTIPGGWARCWVRCSWPRSVT